MPVRIVRIVNDPEKPVEEWEADIKSPYIFNEDQPAEVCAACTDLAARHAAQGYPVVINGDAARADVLCFEVYDLAWAVDQPRWLIRPALVTAEQLAAERIESELRQMQTEQSIRLAHADLPTPSVEAVQSDDRKRKEPRLRIVMSDSNPGGFKN